ncbi:Reducing polyketide synthase hmp8 [Apiospora sp. TS-2023a]
MPSSTPVNDVPIAVVGLACRFPGDASTATKFWDLLKSGKDAYSPTSTRWNPDGFYHPQTSRLNTIPTRGGHFLQQDPYVFDAAFFNITATEAVALDPKQRITMEVAYEAFENAGMSLASVSGTQTACYIGAGVSDYRQAIERDFMHSPKYHLLGTGEEMISNRTSHFFNIHGPSATIFTACSSSLVATHLACQSLRTGESEMAITGGIGLMLTPDFTTHLNNLSFLSPEGRSKAFDESAQGYGRGEGCGILILKRLDKAIQDGDSVRAIIRATGANSDGYTQGVTMPSMEAQAALIKYVYESNGLDFASTQYVEAHGTGTKAGDPIEAEAIYRTIGQGASPKRKLWIGSVKPNIGHLEATAGVAGIIKGILALEHGLIPPNLHFTRANPAIPFDDWNMAVPTKLTPWPMARSKRMSVSGFGMGGTNGHVVLEAFDPSRHRFTPSGSGSGDGDGAAGMPLLLPGRNPKHRSRLFVFSSHDQAGFRRNAAALIEHLDGLGPAAASPEYLANLARTLAGAKSRLAWKATCVADGVAELRDYLATRPGEGASREGDSRSSTGPPRIGLVFTGQGAQWARMGVELLERPVFADSVARSADVLQKLGCLWDPVEELRKTEAESQLGRPEMSQTICSMLQIALVDELQAWGVAPTRVVGHSSGEIAAAYASGALSHHDAIAAAYFRGVASTALRTEAPELRGGMMAVGCSQEEADAVIAQVKLDGSGKANVACVNSPSSVTLSGDVEALEQLRTVFEERKIFARRLKVEMAYHSVHMNKVFGIYSAAIANIQPNTLIPQQSGSSEDARRHPVMVSSVTGQQVEPELLGPYYWVRNLVSPVLFSDAVKELVCPEETDENDANNNDGTTTTTVDLLIEVGPHSALGGPVEQILNHHGIENVSYKSMLTRGKNSLDTVLALVADLFMAGVPLDLSRANGDLNARFLTDLPPYQFNHSRRFRHETRIQRELVNRQVPQKSIIGSQAPMMDETQHVWRNLLRLEDEPWVRGHMVGGTVLFPAAGFLSMVIEAAHQLKEPGKRARSVRLRDVSVSAAMAIPEDVSTEVIIHIRPHLIATTGSTPASWWEFTVSSCVGADQLRDNCRGLLTVEYFETTSVQMASEDARVEQDQLSQYHRQVEECTTQCTKEEFYGQFEKTGWKYGDIFQGLDNVHLGEGKMTYDLTLFDIGETFSKGQPERPFLINVPALDAIFQACLGTTYRKGRFVFDRPLLPTFFGELEISLDFPSDPGCVLHGMSTSRQQIHNEVSTNIATFDETLSRMYLSAKDFRVSELSGDSEDQVARQAQGHPADITSETHWNYALELLRPDELGELVSAVSPEKRLVELLRIYLHQNPAANVFELVPSLDALSNTSLSLLPKGAIHPSQVKYAVESKTGVAADSSTVDRNIEGEVVFLDLSEAKLPDGVSPPDLVVVDQSADAFSDIEKAMAHLVQLTKPDGAVLLTVNKDMKAATDASLETKGFRLITDVVDQEERLLALYQGLNPERHTNGVVKGDITIVTPRKQSSAVQSFSSSLQEALEDHGYGSSVISWTEFSPGPSDGGLEGRTFISLLELDQPFLEEIGEEDFHQLRRLVLGCERLLWLVCGDHPVMSLVEGLARTIRTEVAGTRFQILHLEGEETAARHGPATAARILTSRTRDDEFQERNGLVQVSRIFNSHEGNEAVRSALEDSVQVQSLAGPGTPPLRLKIGRPGLLDTLTFVNDDRMEVALGETEIEVEVKATGVNFKDIMASMGLVEVSLIGHEASGVVVSVGREASSRFRPGDRVTMLRDGMHATRIRIDHRLAVKIPDSMLFEEAAALPMVHVTAYHALVNVAKLRAGQSVLIHAAAGGVGQAALQLAAHLKLEVYATVGSEDKRRLVRERFGVPDERIFHSRDASFAKAVRRATGGRGVDCVLNSLSGELLRVSWEGCMAPFGTFVEIGLRDITQNTRLDMRPFRHSVTFAFMDIADFFTRDLDALGHILEDCFALVGQGVLTVSAPLTVYPVGEVGTAFRTMQQGKHRGKLVLSLEGDARAPVLRRAKDALQFDPGATYLFVGGLGGLGRSLAQEFVQCGARNLAFISRSGSTNIAAQALLDELAGHDGVRAKVYRADIADETSFRGAMKQCEHDLPPVRGVLQMAMVLRDVVFEKMSHEAWAEPLRPKVRGSWNLHQHFDHTRPLDFFILCSSVSGVFGNAGQAQYAAGNTYQDALAHYRRARGLRAVAVDLGIMRDVGVLAEQGAVGQLLQLEEALGIREPAFRALIKSLIRRQQEGTGDAGNACPAQVTVGLGTADILAAHGLPPPDHFQNDARFGPLAVMTSAGGQAAGGASGSDPAAATVSLSSRLALAADKEQAVEWITEGLVAKVADILQVPASEVDPARPMYRYGVDSLVALEVRNWIAREMKANMALLEILAAVPMDVFAGKIAEKSKLVADLE